jgi:hypothetical protein
VFAGRLSRNRLMLALAALALVALAVVLVFRAGGASTSEAEHEHESNSESLVAFAREHPNALRAKLPLAVLREKLEGGGKEAKREKLSGPAQFAVDARAWPRTYVSAERADAARRAYARAPARIAGARTLAENWTELGPVTPTVPAQVTYTGGPTTNSGRVTAMAITPTGCKLYVAAAGGGIWRSDNACGATPTWTPIDSGLTSLSFGSLVIDPTDPNILYAGSGEPNGSSDSEAGVGLFKSTDAGATWTLLSDSVPIAKDRSIATIAIDPNDHTHVLIGTALARHGSSSSNGGRRTPPNAPALGVYASSDAGATWSNAPIFSKPGDPTDPASGNDFFNGGVNRLEFDPTNDDIWAAVIGYGLWRSQDAGATFGHVFATKYPADGPPATADSTGDRTEFDLVKEGAHTRVYTGDSSDDNAYSALFRVNDAEIKTATTLIGAGADNAGWTSLSDPDIANTPGFTSYFWCHTQCGYDAFVVGQDGTDTVYLGGSMNYDEIFGATGATPADNVTPNRTNGRAVVRSTDAGVSFTDMTNDAKPNVQDDPGGDPSTLATGQHPDQHALVIDPTDPNRFFVGSDGGVVRVAGPFVSDSARCTARDTPVGTPPAPPFTSAELALCQKALSAVPTTIDSLNDGLRTLQFQSLSVNPSKPASDIIGGTQDNGTWAWDGATSWAESIGGDGGQSAIDAASNTRVHTYFGPTTDVNFNGADPDTWDYISQPLDDANAGCGSGDPRGECFSFYVPMTADPVTPASLYTGGEYVWRTQDSGGNKADLDAHCRETAFLIGDRTTVCGDWQRLGGAAGHIGTSANYIVAAERTAADKGTLWLGRRRGGVFVSHNIDATLASKVSFSEVTSAKLPNRFVSSIHVDPLDANHAWVSYSGYDAYTPSTPGHVFEIRLDPAGGAPTVSELSLNLGDQPITDLVRDDATGDLYASTDFGILRRPNGAPAWEKAADGLPLVATYGLTISCNGRLLYAATHGRGIWRVKLATADTAPCTPPPAPSGGGGTTTTVTTPAPTVTTPGPTVTTPGTPPPALRAAKFGSVKTKVTRKGTRRTIRVTVGVTNVRSLRASVYNSAGKRLTRRTITVRKDGTVVFSLVVHVKRAQKLKLALLGGGTTASNAVKKLTVRV